MFNFRKDKQLKHSTYVMNNSFSIGCHQSICNNAKNYVIYKFKKFLSKFNENKESINYRIYRNGWFTFG